MKWGRVRVETFLMMLITLTKKQKISSGVQGSTEGSKKYQGENYCIH